MPVPKTPEGYALWRKRISAAMKGIKRTPEHQAKLNAAQTGRPKPPEVRLKISKTLTGRPGHKHQEPARKAISAAQRQRWAPVRSADSRKTYELRMWRQAVLERDGYRCVSCRTDKDLHTHHIKLWKHHPELRFDLSNGQTLCKSCHARADNLGRAAHARSR
jgi:5-methylcytosine-specific restriction endonuclease McrA